MNSNKSHRALVVLAIAALGFLATPAEATVKGEAEVVIEWNQILQTNLPGSAGVFSLRYYAMMHIAMFDAINSIERDYERYHVQVPAGPTASAEAAAAQAAHDVLVALLPTATATFDAALKNQLAKIHWWRAAQGAAVGKKVAQAVLDWRTGDGFEQPDPPYLPPPIAGVWQGTPPGQVAAGVRFANVEPFGLLTATQFLPDPPPLLNSPQYATDFEQVKLLGSSASASRTADQALVAKLFAGPPSYSPNPFALWSNIARDLARSRHLSLIKTARLFALINAATNDGLQTAHTSKFVYGLWRPVTAINRADEDHNDATAPEPGWAPLLGTPPYPSHASNLTCIAASAARSLARTFRTDAIPFTVTWTGTGGVANETRSYTSFSQLAEEAGLSRVYGGIHFLFELTESHESCKKVADYLFENYMRPKH